MRIDQLVDRKHVIKQWATDTGTVTCEQPMFLDVTSTAYGDE